MLDFLLNAGVLILIVSTSAWLTNTYTRRAYYRCRKCRNLNAKRRAHCRICGEPLEQC